MSVLDNVVGFLFPAAPVVKQEARNVDAAVKQVVEASPTWTYTAGATVDLPAGRAEEFARERTTTSTATPSASKVPLMWVLGLGGVALWLLTRKR